MDIGRIGKDSSCFRLCNYVRYCSRANTRNLDEYEGYGEVDEQLLTEVLKVKDIIREKVAALGPVKQ